MILSLALLSTPAHAQRYLTEFVGTTQVATTAGHVAIDTTLSFTSQTNRSLGGSFQLVETDLRGNTELELFSVEATLASSGQCPARFSSRDTSGHLQLDEYVFDTNAFALYGSFDLASDVGSVKLADGRLSGPTAYLNPPADFLDLPSPIGSLELVGTDGRESLTVELGDVGTNGAARGVAFSDVADVYDVVFSANSRWFYVLAVAEDGMVFGRGAVTLDRYGLPVYASGSFEELTETGKVLDEGTFTIDLR